MSKELVISSNRHETKVAVLEDDQLVELFFQRANEYSLAGSIHKGRVTRVLPGMQSAFVDLGLERDCFLYVTDFFEENDDVDSMEDAKPSVVSAAGGRDRDRDRDRDRGSRDRGGRDRDRGRGRDRGAFVAAPVVTQEPVAEVAEAAEPVEAAAIVEGEVAGSEATAVGAPGESAEDRRGRRRRRGRRGRAGGFPESKYASVTGEAEEGEEAGDEEPAVAVAEAAEAVEVPVATEEVFLLPGESLRKYRGGAQPAPVEKRHNEPSREPFRNRGPRREEPKREPVARVEKAVASVVESHSAPEFHHHHEQVEPEAVIQQVAVETHRLAPHQVEEAHHPDRHHVVELHHLEPEMRELTNPEIQVIQENRVEAAEEAAYAALEQEKGAPSLVAAAGSHEALSVVEVLENADITEAEAHHHEIHLHELGSFDSAAEELDDDGNEGELATDGAGKEGVDPAQAPQGLTASVRDRDRNARFQQSRGRRGRRGRRGEPDNRGPRPEGEAAAAPVIEGVAVGVERPDRSAERPERGDRPERTERSERPERAERTERSERSERDRGGRPSRPPMPSITDLLKPGQEILVQVAKEPIGQKGARITSHIALPGRYCVFMPTVEHMGVSRKIASDDERLRLKKILQAQRGALSGGFIIRTAGEGKSEEEITSDMLFLHSLWMDLKAKAERKPAPVLVHHDLDIVQRIIRDQLTTTFKNIWLDNEELYESTVHFVERFQPALMNRVRLYTRPTPIFDHFAVTTELEKALRPKVWLKSGGYIVINQTEALVAIDVNTGKFVGKSNRLEDTIVKTNTEAVKEIVRQMRLRDLGGIIVVDFIDMDERKNRAKVMQTLEEAMRSDRAPYKILQFNDFGLVAITRKRVKQSLERTLCAPCPYCEGAGYVKSVQTVIGEILTEATKMAKVFDGKDVILRVNPELAKVLKSTETHFLQELEEILGKPVMVKGDPAVHQEKFDMAS